MAMVLDAFMSNFTSLLTQMVQDEVGMLLGVPGEIEKLQRTVGAIQCLLADAEQKKIESRAVQRWLMELKDVMYDADDTVDLCQIKAQERSEECSAYSSSSKKPTGCGLLNLLSCFRNPVFAHEIGIRIRDINSRLEEIARRKTELGLMELQGAAAAVGQPRVRRRVDTFVNRTTDHVLVQEDIVGEKIEDDARLLVSWLTEEENGVRERVSVVAIVGMGGIGKTTLAKRIFNDSEIEAEFSLKMWVCVSQEVKGVELLKSIIREAGGEHGAAHERWELVPLLQDLVHGKKFLLVLDDVWEESRAVWDELLRAPMMGGAHASRLLITTRDERVANGMRATRSHRVEKLSEEDGWSLLSKQVFHNEEGSKIQEFIDIGLQLVRKCDGLPLAIKSIGGVLCMKSKTVMEWQAVLRSNMWSMKGLPEDVHRAIYLSYDDLSPPLKQCFILCSLFPGDFILGQSSLIYLWFAEGFLQDNGNLWELGSEYYRELLLRNLLEPAENVYDQSVCKMHDILWSFARYLGKGENLILRERESIPKQEFSSKLRRLSAQKHERNTEIVIKEKWLRTLFIQYRIPENALVYLCGTHSNLRILDLRCSTISTLPDALTRLVHLRYLDLNLSKIRIIPTSIGNLKNLVFLCFRECTELAQVPNSITNLKQLRCLSFFDSKVETIPVGLKNLTNLIELVGFKLDNNSLKGFSSLDELETLSQLVYLYLDGLERVSEIDIAKRAKLSSKEQLQQLNLKYTSLSWKDQLSQTNENKVTVEGILNELSPPRSLQILSIEGYFGNCLPNWLNLRLALPSLRYLDINKCNCFKNIATLGQLPNLDSLHIRDAYSVVSVKEEFFGPDTKNRDSTATNCSAIAPFPNLRVLAFEGMPNWKEWQWNKEKPAMRNLKKLFIISCPQLGYLPEGLLHHATSLEYLDIDGANNLITIENFPSIKDLRVGSSPNLEKISNLRTISHIGIRDCPNLKTLENINKSLHRIEFWDSEMVVLPECLMTTMPQHLKISCSEELLRNIASQGKDGPELHKFKHIPKVEICSLDESLHVTYQKTPFNLTADFNESVGN